MDHHGGNQFESLKREATKLERQLEEKVARYQQVCILIFVFAVQFNIVENGCEPYRMIALDSLDVTCWPSMIQIISEEIVILTLDS